MDAAPDGEEEIEAVTGIYTIAETVLGPTKIGITNDARGRFATLQTGNPRSLVSGIWLECRHAADLERRVHKKLGAHRLAGEWFDVSLAAADAALDDVLREGCGPCYPG